MNVLELQKLPTANDDHAPVVSAYSGFSLGCMQTFIQPGTPE